MTVMGRMGETVVEPLTLAYSVVARSSGSGHCRPRPPTCTGLYVARTWTTERHHDKTGGVRERRTVREPSTRIPHTPRCAA